MSVSLSIVIVNYQTPRLTVECLASLKEELGKPVLFTVTVVDNNSGDGSVEYLIEAVKENGWQAWVNILPLPENGGFAYGNNRAIQKIIETRGLTDYIWLLNPDTVVLAGSCGALVRFLDEHPEVGIVGSRLEDPDGTPQVSAFRDHSVVSEFLSAFRLGLASTLLHKWVVAQAPQSVYPVKTDWVSGASMMIRGAVFDDVGLLDEKYFMYFEEVDFCLKARKEGWPCWYVPASRVVHLVGAASGISDNRRKARRRPAYWFESRRRFFLNHHGKRALFWADTLWILGYGLWRIRRRLQRKPDLDPPYFLKDFFFQSVFCKGFGK